MDLKRFKKHHKRFNNFPLSKNEWQTPDYEEYLEAIHRDKKCHDWYVTEQIKKAGINYKRFCCLFMTEELLISRFNIALGVAKIYVIGNQQCTVFGKYKYPVLVNKNALIR